MRIGSARVVRADACPSIHWLLNFRIVGIAMRLPADTVSELILVAWRTRRLFPINQGHLSEFPVRRLTAAL